MELGVTDSHGLSLSFTCEITEGADTLREWAQEIADKASAEGGPSGAAMICGDCGASEDFLRHKTVKEALIQIDEFERTHAGCEGTGNDE